MSRKVALLVTAEVQTRIVVKVADDFDVENIKDGEFCYISSAASSRASKMPGAASFSAWVSVGRSRPETL